MLMLIKVANYAKAFESRAATEARFPLRWASRDKGEHQVSGGTSVLPALDLEDNGDLPGIPLDLGLHGCLVRLLCPGSKFRERPCRMSISGVCEWMNVWARSLHVTCLRPWSLKTTNGLVGLCRPVKTEPLTEPAAAARLAVWRHFVIFSQVYCWIWPSLCSGPLRSQSS